MIRTLIRALIRTIYCTLKFRTQLCTNFRTYIRTRKIRALIRALIRTIYCTLKFRTHICTHFRAYFRTRNIRAILMVRNEARIKVRKIFVPLIVPKFVHPKNSSKISYPVEFSGNAVSLGNFRNDFLMDYKTANCFDKWTDFI
jgi:hypothetical protein